MSCLSQSIERDDHDQPKGKADEEHDAKDFVPALTVRNEGEEHKSCRTASRSCEQKYAHCVASLVVMKQVSDGPTEVRDCGR